MTETWRALLLASALALPVAASAVTLTDVRIGVHPEYTRVVLETDAKAPYIVDAGEREIVVHVDAAAAAEAVTAKSPHLIWAKVEPTQIGADVRLQLKQPTDVKAMVLTGPHRIVLDLYPRKGVPAPLPAPELLIEEEPEEADLALPPPSEAEAETEDAEVAADVAAEGEPEAELAEDEPEAEPEAAPDAEAPEALAGEAGAAGEPAAGDETETAPEAPVSDALAAAPDAAATPEPPARAAPTTPLAPAPSSGGSLFGSPYLLGAAAVALLLVFLFLRRLGKGGKPAAEREGMGLPPLDEAPERGATAAAAGDGDGSVFDVEAEAILPPPKDDDSLPQLRSAAPEPVDETERRIVALERRIEELVDARERLERQVSAQTEELRVQRAAIARTQRVLRTVAPRSEDDPSGTGGEPR